ncbi:hypothetical protein [Natranaerofaba carboxydovora]|uniref:hypothetical protein n=1 Tax=Natranaerofaba carboxydovora TaxID=2742683 RepID=UPI001F1342A9|nr:hypothetical protein [Natranaerofaba carboxydovora]UMZ73561.1 hypothetical protein ACONDI_01116 [Natranaerofaba carboxydovora]
MKKTVITIFICIFLLMLSPGAKASVITDEAGFEPLEGKELGYSESYQQIELWHYSGGYFGYNIDGQTGTVSEGDATDVVLRLEHIEEEIADLLIADIEHPKEVQEYLADGGSIEDIGIYFSVDDDDVDKDNMFEDTDFEYTLTETGLEVEYNPAFHFDPHEYVYLDDSMNVLLPRVVPGYGLEGFSMWSGGSER